MKFARKKYSDKIVFLFIEKLYIHIFYSWDTYLLKFSDWELIAYDKYCLFLLVSRLWLNFNDDDIV